MQTNGFHCNWNLEAKRTKTIPQTTCSHWNNKLRRNWSTRGEFTETQVPKRARIHGLVVQIPQKGWSPSSYNSLPNDPKKTQQIKRKT